MTDHLKAYGKAAHRVQTAIQVLMELDPNYTATTPKHLRVGVDMSKSDMSGLARLLMQKGIITLDEYLESITIAAQNEADSYEKIVQTVLSNRKIKTV